MKKISLLFIASLSLLSSCKQKSIAGTYGFQMGKENGTHFGFYITLTDEYTTLESQPEVTDKYKKCEFSFSMETGDSESGSSIITLIGTMLKQEGQDVIKVPAYYYQSGKKINDIEEELKVGIDFAFLKDIYDDVDTTDLSFPTLQPDTIEKLIYTTYGDNKVTMYIPVGEIDAIYQLYWYGVDVTYTSGDGIKIGESPDGVHDVGTHPTQEEVAAINEHFGTNHADLSSIIGLSLSTYRDYHTLAMGMVKR